MKRKEKWEELAAKNGKTEAAGNKKGQPLSQDGWPGLSHAALGVAIVANCNPLVCVLWLTTNLKTKSMNGLRVRPADWAASPVFRGGNAAARSKNPGILAGG